jgi:hypothetical protein
MLLEMSFKVSSILSTFNKKCRQLVSRM